MQLSRPKLSFWERLYLPQIFKGMWLTLKHIPKKKITMQYPEQQPTILDNYRGAPVLVSDADGRVKCVACQLCEFVCPPKAIRITAGERHGADKNVEKQPEDFEIDMLRCIYCGLCQEVCPEEAIFLRRDFAITGYSRDELIFHKDKLLELGGVHQDEVWKWKNK